MSICRAAILFLSLGVICGAWTSDPYPSWQRATLQSSRATGFLASSNSNEIDVSDLGLSMEDLEAPLPSELLEGIEASGYESTSRIPTVQDDGCSWTENGDTMDVTLKIPGLRGQPAACLAVVFSTSTATITAFGHNVWSCLLKGVVDADSASFVTEDGADMVPVIQLSVKKEDASLRWGGFIEQIGEDSIL
ncbi:expressed unknown protein [Seminavis robusta]|uniref:Uncharacterized protein n=1 Tax=Seminavis robusta TaxID=568900 RepID=A0A9N8HHF6_9STRA|nr:expressed unknown protein [Seminavis robusta]|eukprot:Sro446_g144620.1 n/a (192) ;mRNA; f:5444-6019